jgi:hypothetical protein
MKQEIKTIQLQIRLDWSREFDEIIFHFHPHVLLEHCFRKSLKVKSVSPGYSTILCTLYVVKYNRLDILVEGEDENYSYFNLSVSEKGCGRGKEAGGGLGEN